jgi:hypothetical protein
VPYGTALWQVGGSKQQNSMFKVRITHAQDYLMKKERLYSLILK